MNDVVVNRDVLGDRAPDTPNKIGVFISYSFEIESLARKLKDKLQVLDDQNRLDLLIASDLGGKKWREEIHDRLTSDRILILPYPHRTMKLDWVCFELGAFHNAGTPICIMNTNLESPPDQIGEWEAYKANPIELKQFFTDLFERGTFTNGSALNPKLSTDPDFRQRLKDAVAEIQSEFAAFRQDEKFFARRIRILTPPAVSATGAKLPSKLNFQNAVVEGSDDALAIFNVQSGVAWNAFKESCASYSSTTWLEEIERMLQVTRDKILAHTLTPFRTRAKRCFIPVVSRIKSIEGVPSKLSVIFVELSGDMRIGAEVIGNYDAMPANWNVLFTLLDIGRRFRWDVLDPVRTALRGELRNESVEKWRAEAQRVLRVARTIQKELASIGMRGEDHFYAAFSPEIAKTLAERMAGYQEAEDQYAKAISEGDLDRTLKELGKISRFNVDFFEHTARQIHQYVKGLN